MIELEPIEKLQLCSLKNKGYFNIKNKLYCLLYQLNKKDILVFKNNKFKFGEFKEDELNIPYEEKFLKLVKNKRYYELKEELNKMHFKPTLVRKGIIREHIKEAKIKLFNKVTLEKTDKFYDIYNDIMGKTNNDPLIYIICDKTKNDENIRKLVEKIIEKINICE